MQFKRNNIKKLWYIPVFSFLMPLASPFGLLYVGSVTKKHTWLAVFFVTLLIQIFSVAFLFSEKSLIFNIGVLGLFSNWTFTLVCMISTAGKVLQAHTGTTPPPVSAGAATPQVPNNPASANVPKSESQILGEKFINSLYKWIKEIDSYEMKNDIYEMINLCSIVLKRNDEESLRFFNRYGDRVEGMLEKYNHLENTPLNTPEMRKSMGLIEKSVSDIVVAFENEIKQMYKKDLLDLDADTTVFVQELRNKGLID